MQFKGMIHQQPVIILCDSGSTHSFVDYHWATEVNWPITPTSVLNVTMASEDKVQCQGICKGVPVRLGPVTFVLDLYLLSLPRMDVVLGINWLRKLGRMTVDFSTLRMEFAYQGPEVVLQGIVDSQPQPRQFAVSLLEVDTKKFPLATRETQLQTLLSKFKEVF